VTRFIVRVELPNKPPADYDQLHKDMRKAKYFRVIEGENGWWHLPHGEYTCTATDWTAQTIRDEVLEIASGSHPKPRVFATEAGGGLAWVNLRPVTPQDPAPDDT
jgi:hypothetical protein